MECRQTHSVDLAGHIAECEINYARLLQILPGLREGRTEWRFDIGSNASIKIHMRLKESAPYTSMIDVVQVSGDMALPALQLKLCHDADVAEITAWDKHRHWQPSYDYPNPKMYQPDEKFALNRFLGEWLDFCLNHGLVPPDICDSVLVSGNS